MKSLLGFIWIIVYLMFAIGFVTEFRNFPPTLAFTFGIVLGGIGMFGFEELKEKDKK